jgi:hypothetical protein
MMTSMFHPATIQLLQLQSRGRRRRIWHRFCQPRRLLLSAIACVLGVVWLGNAALTIWLREQGSTETLQALLSLGLVMYAGWHFANAAFFPPESPFDWTPAERDLLAAMPLRPYDLVTYQLASVTVPTLLKAGLFTLLLLPDMRCVPLGFAGVLLAMLFLEMLRMAIQIATWGMGRKVFLAYRAVVVAGLVAAGLQICLVIVRAATLDRTQVNPGILRGILETMVQLNASGFGDLALPFRPFIDLILADKITAPNMGLVAVTLTTVTALVALVIRLYASTIQRLAEREKRNYQTNDAAREMLADDLRNENGTMPNTTLKLQLRHTPRFAGAGALAWRQLLGARRHWGSLLTAMIAPAVIAGAPCFVIPDANFAFLSITGTLAFYTFLLLPTALRFDFRRDLDRLAILKGLPITPAAVVIGQTFAPVLIATLFQTAVLAFVVIVRSLPPHYLLTMMLVMLPINVLVFGLDNLIYLLYPYRIQQEGVEIFLRTMLTFTGKGLLFTLGLVVISVWGFTAAALTHAVSAWTGSTVSSYAIFVVGMIVGPSLLTAIVLYGLCETYRSMDPIEDLPR